HDRINRKLIFSMGTPKAKLYPGKSSSTRHILSRDGSILYSTPPIDTILAINLCSCRVCGRGFAVNADAERHGYKPVLRLTTTDAVHETGKHPFRVVRKRQSPCLCCS